jgi:hypothetical protein
LRRHDPEGFGLREPLEFLQDRGDAAAIEPELDRGAGEVYLDEGALAGGEDIPLAEDKIEACAGGE